MTLRGLRTLHARLAVHGRNAPELASWLAAAAAGAQGLSSRACRRIPGHEMARRQQSGFGAIVSFELHGGIPAVKAFVAGLKYFSLAESLGGVESLVAHPASMTHAAMSEAARRAAGLTDGLLRLSVGIEALEDLRADLAAGLARCCARSETLLP